MHKTSCATLTAVLAESHLIGSVPGLLPLISSRNQRLSLCVSERSKALRAVLRLAL